VFIQWSEEAIKEAKARFGSDPQVWKLVFDTEDCGCSVNGVPTLWAIKAPDIGELKAESNAFEVWYVPQHAVFFDEQLRISYFSNNRSFQLASDGQIYTNRLKLEDKR
jgi:uncharacterized protein YqkB